jgi:hypothetical protein
MIWIPMAIGAAIGAAKNVGDQQQANAQRKAQSQLTRYSPWTGIQGTAVKDPSLIGNVAQGAAAGAMLGQGAAAATPATAGATTGAAGAAGAAPSFGFLDGTNEALQKGFATSAAQGAGTAGATEMAGTGAAKFSLGGSTAANTAPFKLGAAGGYGSQFGLDGTGSAGALGSWGQMPMSEDIEKYMARVKNPYDFK